MAKYRQVYVEFWQDGFVLDLTPEEKYFYIYLMTNSKTSQCGIYELPKRVIETETGYNRETVEKLLQRFVEYGKIKYDHTTKEIMILNWIKYNSIKSPKVIACIKKELETIKNVGFIRELLILAKQYGYPIDTLSKDYGEEEEREEEEEEEEEREEEGEEEPRTNEEKNSANATFFYQQNFGPLSPFIGDCITDWEKDLGSILVIEAMKRALKQQKKWKYAEGILRDWASQNVKSLDDVFALDTEFEKRKGDGSGKEGTVQQYRTSNGRPSEKTAEQAIREAENARKAWGGG